MLIFAIVRYCVVCILQTPTGCNGWYCGRNILQGGRYASHLEKTGTQAYSAAIGNIARQTLHIGRQIDHTKNLLEGVPEIYVLYLLIMLSKTRPSLDL